MVLLRADGTPTYMHSVVVDDIDMGITHVIRGDDHLTNAFRQVQLYRALGAEPPRFAHIPLIHGPDGAKLSKRHGALSVTEYREMGLLPEAMRNYLLRLGWGHGDAEIITTEQAVAWFDLDGVGRAPARLDMAKLMSVNAHWLRERPDAELVALVRPRLEAMGLPVDAEGEARLLAGMAGLKQRARTLVELATSASFYVRPRPLAARCRRRKGAGAAGRGRRWATSRSRWRRWRVGASPCSRPHAAHAPRRWACRSGSWRRACARRSRAPASRPGCSR